MACFYVFGLTIFWECQIVSEVFFKNWPIYALQGAVIQIVQYITPFVAFGGNLKTFVQDYFIQVIQAEYLDL